MGNVNVWGSSSCFFGFVALLRQVGHHLVAVISLEQDHAVLGVAAHAALALQRAAKVIQIVRLANETCDARYLLVALQPVQVDAEVLLSMGSSTYMKAICAFIFSSGAVKQ